MLLFTLKWFVKPSNYVQFEPDCIVHILFTYIYLVSESATFNQDIFQKKSYKVLF